MVNKVTTSCSFAVVLADLLNIVFGIARAMVSSWKLLTHSDIDCYSFVSLFLKTPFLPFVLFVYFTSTYIDF